MKSAYLRVNLPSGIVPPRIDREKLAMEQTEYAVMAAVEGRHWWYGGMRAITAAILDPLYAGRSNLRILDAGCGTGGNVWFLQRYGQVVGLELAPEALEQSIPCLSGKLARGSVLTLPFANDSFDLVTSFDVLYHRGVPDEMPALHETYRVLRSGGQLLLRLPAYQFLRSKHDDAVHTRRRYTATDVKQLLAAAGFRIERCSYIVSLLFPVVLAQRLIEQRSTTYEQHVSDLALPVPPINTALRWPLALEAAWVSLGGVFPFGLSVICLASCNKST